MSDFEMDLSSYGAPGFVFRDRLDMSGHQSGRVDPHLNSEVMRADFSEQVVVRDLAHIQLPGFNGMQNG